MKSDMEWGPWIEYGVAVYDRELHDWFLEEDGDGWITFHARVEAESYVDQLGLNIRDVRVVERETSRWRFSESG